MAIIGTVTYPTDSTWEVQVTDLAPGANAFTVSDGTDSAQVQVDLTVPVNLAGASGGAAQAAASASQEQKLTGTAAGAASTVSSISAKTPFDVSFLSAWDIEASNGNFVVLGISEWQVESSTGAQLDLSIQALGRTTDQLAGAADGRADASGTLAVEHRLSGTSTGRADASSFFSDIYSSGTATGRGGATGTLHQDIPLSGIAEGHSDAGVVDFSKMSLFESFATCESLTDAFKPRRVAASAANLRSKVGSPTILLTSVGSVEPPARPSRPTNTRATRGDS